MKLIGLHVENFGCLHEIDTSFSEGLNLRIAPNGRGKSTLAVFIKAMLYGLPASTKRSLIENERKRYTPWQGGAFGGALDLTVDGEDYRIERFFGAKEAEDTLKVIALASGEEAAVPWKDAPGEGIFGVDAEAFERSVYLSQRPDSSIRDGTVSIHTKLNRLLDATDDMGNYDRAMAALEDRRRYYQHLSGGGGKIPEDRERLYALEEQIQRGREALESAEQLRQQDRQATEKAEEWQRRQAACDRQLEEWHLAKEKQLLFDRVSSLETEIRQEKEELRRCLAEVGGKLPSAEAIEQLSRLAAAEREEEARRAALLPSPADTEEKERLCADFPNGPMTEEQKTELRAAAAAWQKAELVAEACRATPPEESPAPDPTASWFRNPGNIGLGLWALLSLIGVGFGFLWMPVGIVGFVSLTLSAVFGGLRIRSRRAEARRRTTEEENAREKGAAAAQLCGQAREKFVAAWLRRTSRPVPPSGNVLPETEALIGRSERLRVLREREEELSCHRREAETRLLAVRDELRDMRKRYPGAPADPSGAVGWLTERRQSLLDRASALERKQEARQALYEANQMGSEEFQRLLSVAASVSRDDLLSLQKDLSRQRSEQEEETARRRREIRRLEQEGESCADGENEAACLREQVAREEKNLAAVVGAQKYLKMAREQLSRRYLETMKKRFAAYLTDLTGEEYTFTMDGEFRVKLRLTGAGRDPDALSVGWRELVGFCARLSLVDAMYEGETPFLILDDPFANLDDEKRAAARGLVARLAERYQILYLSCRASDDQR